MRCRSLLLAACVSLSAAAALADDVNTVFDIPRQPLVKALRQFADQTGLQLAYEASIVNGYTSPAVKGTISAREALQRLLLGSDLQFEFIDRRTVVLSPLEPQAEVGAVRSGFSVAALLMTMFSPLAATAQTVGAENSSVIETISVFGTLDSEVSIGSKSGQSLRETPKSVTLVTRERIEAQNLTSLADTLKQTTGVTVKSYTSADNAYFSRGFRVQTVQMDGGAPAISGSFGSYLTPDTAAYDHVEMLRGVDGMYTGAGEPGGVINLVRKRAKSDAEVQLNLSAGRWNAYRSELDVTGPVTSDGRLRARGVAAYENRDYFYDRAESDRKMFFGTAEYDITDSTVAIIGASYENRKEDGFFFRGLPRYADGSDLKLSRSTAFNPDWNHNYTTTKEYFARLEQQFGETGTIKLNVTRLDQHTERALMNSYGPVNPVTNTEPMALGSSTRFGAVQDLLDLSVSGTFKLFGLEHRYTVGADYADVDGSGEQGFDLLTYQYPSTRTIDVFNFDASSYARPVARPLYRYPDNGQTQRGFYGTLGLQLAEPVRLTLGGRYGEFHYENTYLPINPNGSTGNPSSTRYNDSKFIPSAALSWDFARDWTVYASYAQTFRAQANLLQGPPPGSTPLDPLTGDGYELGVKGEFFGVLNAAFAVYSVKRQDQGALDQRYGFFAGSNGRNCCYIQQVDIESEGFDAELSGTVLPGWQVFGGYTYNTSKYNGGATTLYSSGAYYLNQTPEHMLKLWTTWQLPNALSRWTINAGVVAQTETSATGTALASLNSTTYVPYEYTQASYAVWNASVQYRVNDNWSVGLYGDNLFDKTYYQVIATATGENVYGVPRNYVLNVRGRW
ncbi:TonB-dependent siderophore receptor [Steroidobacter sp.]|uniref:TonB-dependent siderophore receptor n=1 Tax=Steroidobacter sp. TaxID=1978227 RepID=UPI001A641D6E|nr:TonB-dependent receptor [Steroidobacter sp.]MBL8266575.1 TonB-dependent siderophore receptor [Steroidobacter sp.]